MHDNVLKKKSLILKQSCKICFDLRYNTFSFKMATKTEYFKILDD